MELGDVGEEGGREDLRLGSEVGVGGRSRREELWRLMWRKTVRSNLDNEDVGERKGRVGRLRTKISRHKKNRQTKQCYKNDAANADRAHVTWGRGAVQMGRTAGMLLWHTSVGMLWLHTSYIC